MTDVTSSVSGGVGYLMFNRAEARNAVFPEMLDEAIAALHCLEHDDSVRVIVVGGHGDAFCAGADRELFLAKLPGKTAEEIQKDIYTRFMGFARALKLCSKPTIAMVHGAAVGAGCEFAVACDFRIASSTALFWENWIDLGILPPLGGMYLLPRLIGLERASEMVLCARRVKADEALSWGLVSRVVKPEHLSETTEEFARSLARRSSRAVAVARQSLRRGLDSNLSAEWDFTLQAQALLLTGPDFREAMQAMSEKRAPIFS